MPSGFISQFKRNLRIRESLILKNYMLNEHILFYIFTELHLSEDIATYFFGTSNWLTVFEYGQ